MSDEQRTEVMSGENGEPCGSCGFPLATDQRYCLNCGARRGGPRLDYREYVGGPAEPQESGAPAPGTAPAPASAPARDSSPLVAVGGIGILGLMLLVGVLIGRGGGGEQPAPQVLQVPAGGATVAEEAGATASTGSEKPDATEKVSDKDADKGGSGSTGKPGSIDQPEQITADELEALENTSGDDYAEAAEKLPDTIQLPGEPPPKDNEEPGGGTDATVIE